MPTPEQILNGLTTIANQWQPLAIVWHLYFAVLAAGLMLGVHPSKRVGGVLLGLPLLSVSVLAWLSANPFTGTIFGLTAVVLIALALRLPDEPVAIAPTWIMGAGVLMFVFGWIYPHFLDTTSFVPYLYAAPVGLVPCPTLSIVIGLALVVGGLDSRAWSLVLGGVGVFYAFFGALRLGVTIDWILLLGALAILLAVLLPKTGAQAPTPVH